MAQYRRSILIAVKIGMTKTFLDTNVLLRATITQFPFHNEIKTFVDTYLDGETELWISRQVIREYVSQATRPQLFMQPMTASQIDLQYRKMRLLLTLRMRQKP